MSGVVLSAVAERVVNKGGGFATKTVVDEIKDPIGGKIKRTHRHLRSRQRLPGTDYVVFKCPGCGTRNKRSMYDAKGQAGQSLSFKCHHCYREIEVARPPSLTFGVAPPAQHSLVGPDGRPL